MSFLRSLGSVAFVLLLMIIINACGGGASSTDTGKVQPNLFQLSVQASGNGVVSSSPAGINCGPKCAATFPANTKVILTATPGSHFNFVDWSGACSGNSDLCDVNMSGNLSVSATFSAFPVLTVGLQGSGTGTVTSDPTGINCPPACSGSYGRGTHVSLTANPAHGSTFAGWTGACGGAGSCDIALNSNASVSAMFHLVEPPVLTVALDGTGKGGVSSTPSGISCPPTCRATFNPGTQVMLTETPVVPGSVFAGWGGACNGSNNTCTLTVNANAQATAAFNSVQGLNGFNHIIFMAQENRSFDHYFGAMRAYWAATGIPDQSFDGLPQFNPTQGLPPLYGPPPSNPGCDPNGKNGLPFANCVVDNNSSNITSFHLITQCIENVYPHWEGDHYYMDWTNPYIDPSSNPAMNGYVAYNAHISKQQGRNDTMGMRVMGYYDWTDLNYYYFMATNFATSDRFFSPVMTETPANREYLLGGTSQGELGFVGHGKDKELTATTIFEELSAAGVTWKIYVNPQGTPCTPPYTTACLVGNEPIYVKNFVWGLHNLSYPQNLGTIGPPGTCGSTPCDFESDLANGTLPQVIEIAPAGPAGLDEHPAVKDSYPVKMQAGANYVAGIVNSVMQSQEWKDSLFILTYDEAGGAYDHVPPQPQVSPDRIPPLDLFPGEVCYQKNGPACDFTWTSYRIPLIVISPYTKQNYVSHTVADSTAITKLIETRFGVPSLTARDAAQPDLSEFFDFNNPPWMIPPVPPAQVMNAPCYLDHLP